MNLCVLKIIPKADQGKLLLILSISSLISTISSSYFNNFMFLCRPDQGKYHKVQFPPVEPVMSSSPFPSIYQLFCSHICRLKIPTEIIRMEGFNPAYDPENADPDPDFDQEVSFFKLIHSVL